MATITSRWFLRNVSQLCLRSGRRSVEGSLEQAVTSWLEWFANVTWTTTRIQNPLDPDQDGSNISFVPNVIGNAGFTLRLPYDITVSPFVRGTGTYYDSTSKSGRKQFGPYVVPGAKVQKEFIMRSLTVIAAADLNNLADHRYELPWQFRDPGFSALGTLELRF